MNRAKPASRPVQVCTTVNVRRVEAFIGSEPRHRVLGKEQRTERGEVGNGQPGPGTRAATEHIGTAYDPGPYREEGDKEGQGHGFARAGPDPDHDGDEGQRQRQAEKDAGEGLGKHQRGFRSEAGRRSHVRYGQATAPSISAVSAAKIPGSDVSPAIHAANAITAKTHAAIRALRPNGRASRRWLRAVR